MDMILAEYRPGEARSRDAQGKKCAKCPQKLTSYQEAMPQNPSVFLCYRCQEKFTRAQVDNPRLTLVRWVGIESNRKNKGVRAVKVKNLEAIRRSRRFRTAAYFARKCGFCEDSVRKWERQLAGVSEENMAKLTKALNCTEDELVGESA
jgi:hypothetical protein